MKIESRHLQNVSVKFGNDTVKFDKNCQAEVSDEIGKRIILNHPKDIWELGKKPQSELKVTLLEDKSDAIEKLTTDLRIATQKTASLEHELLIAKNEAESWKAVINSTGIKVEGTVETAHAVLEDDIKIIVDLMGKKPDELKKVCSDLGFAEAEWEGKTKNQLVVYIGTKTLTKDATN
jgi:hypothetical protein